MCSANYVPIQGVNDKFQTARAQCLPDSLELHTEPPNLSCGSQSLMWHFVGFFNEYWYDGRTVLKPTWIKAWMPCNARLALCSSGFSWGQAACHSGVPGKGKSPPRCWVEEVTSERDSQKHTCARENLERKLISLNQERDYHWINIYATQAIKGPRNRTEWGDEVLENVAAPITFVRVVVEDCRNSEGEATWNKWRQLLCGFH